MRSMVNVYSSGVRHNFYIFTLIFLFQQNNSFLIDVKYHICEELRTLSIF